MKYKVSVVTKITLLLMTMALAVAMVACQAATPVDKTPVALGGTTLSDMSFPDFVAGTGTAAAQTVTITGSHFKGTELKYTATSSNKSVADATVTGSVVTVTPKGAGTATVTVIATATADDEEGTQSLSFTVTVTAPTPPEPPPDNNAPRLRAGKTLPHHTDLLYGGSREVDLSVYFTDDDGDAITYAAVSTDMGVVTTSVSGSMLTITVVNHGDATITVTATDSYNQSIREVFDVTVINQAPMKTDENTHFGPYSIGHEQSFDLTDFFTDIEGDPLTYTAMSSDVMVATVTGPGTGSMITIEAVAAGTAEITVIANDGDNDSAPNILTVTVSAVPNEVPTVTTGIMDMTLDLMVMDMMESASKTIDLADHFEDPDGKPMPLEYSYTSDMTMIEGSMLTITADASDSGSMTTITVTATDGEAQVSDMFDVTVNAPNAPEWKKEIPDPPAFAHDGADKTYMLEDYFSNATMYAATTNPSGVVTATVSDDLLTLRVDGPGTTTVEITPSNSGGNGVTQSITVTVMEAPVPETGNMPPMLKDGVMTSFNGIALTTKDINLDDYFKDPDGNDALLSYKAKVTLEDDGNTATDDNNVIAIGGAEWASGTCIAGAGDAVDAADTSAPPNGTDIAERMLYICYVAEGMAKITIVAIDSAGDETPVVLEITVIEATDNTQPTAVTATETTGIIEDVSNTARLKVGDTKKVINNKPIVEYFDDSNFVDRAANARGDTLTFEVRRYAGTVSDTAIVDDTTNVLITPGPTQLKDDKGQVSVDLPVRTWNGDRNSKFTLSVTAERGTEVADPADNEDAAEDTIAIIATDEFGMSAVRTFQVRVNHKPQAHSAHSDEEDQKTLEDFESWKDLDIGTTILPSLPLVAAVTADGTAGGYFSDRDGDNLTCKFRTDEANEPDENKVLLDSDGTPGVTIAGNDTAEVTATISSNGKIGTVVVTFWCTDSHEESDSDSVTVNFASGGSIAPF